MSVSTSLITPVNLPIMAVLKQTTRREHESVERRMALPTRLIDKDAYVFLIERFLGFFEPVETNLASVPAIHGLIVDLERRMRAALLKNDLAALGLSSANIRAIPRCDALPGLHNAAQAVGCMYVTEGATLGGQLIVREIQSRNPALLGACSFFRSYGDSVGAMWKQFAAAAEAWSVRHGDDQHIVCETARETFRRLETWLVKSSEKGSSE